MTYVKTRIFLALSILFMTAIVTLIPYVAVMLLGGLGMLFTVFTFTSEFDDDVEKLHKNLQDLFATISVNIRLRFQRPDREW